MTEQHGNQMGIAQSGQCETSASRIRPHDIGLGVDDSGALTIDGITAASLVEEFGAPLWVLSAQTLSKNLADIASAFRSRHENTRIVYASKSNPNPAISSLMVDSGALIDVASQGHIAIALAAGIPANRLVVNGNAKTRKELEWAASAGVAMLNVDSLEEMQRLAELTKNAAKPLPVSIRLATDLSRHSADTSMLASSLESKFGMSEAAARVGAHIALTSPGLEFAGLHHHLGFTAYDSYYDANVDLERRRRCVEQVVDFAATLSHDYSATCQVFNFGGGFRIPSVRGYGPGRIKSIPTIESIAEVLVTYTLDLMKSAELELPEIWVEAGGYISSNAGIYLARVELLKAEPAGEPDWAFLEDTSAYHFVRTLMFGIHHEVLAANRMLDNCTDLAHVAGATCAPDNIAGAVALPPIREHELLAVLDQGAYSESVSTEYCSLPLPATVLVANGVPRLVKQRRTIASVTSDYMLELNQAHL